MLKSMQNMHTSYGCSRLMWQEFACKKSQHNSIGICMHSNQTCRYAYSRLKSTHKVTTRNTHTELMTHMVCMYICTPQVLLILSPMGNSLLHCIYPCLPVLHLLPVHPGSQTQVPGLLQTPFSQGGTQTAEERTQQMAT